MRHREHHDAVARLNEHHADDLLVIARTLGGHPDASAARAERVDHDGIDLVLHTPQGPATTHVPFPDPPADTDDLGKIRVAFVRLARRARSASAPRRDESSSP